MTKPPVQLLFNFPLDSEATFSHFYCAQNHHQPVQALQKTCKDALHPQAYQPDSLALWGNSGCGLSHLLQSVVHEAYATGLSAQYLPLKELHPYPAAAVCEDIEVSPLVCLDDIDAIAGHAAWELALFHVYNRMKAAGHRLIVASHRPLQQVPFILPDLHSRLLSSMVFRIELLHDDAKMHALTLRAHARGFELPPEAAKYMVTHASRSLPSLFQLLNRLDAASLQQQRKITIPFIKSLLAQGQE